MYFNSIPFTSLLIIFTLSHESVSWYIYSEELVASPEGAGKPENNFVFYKTPPSCSDNELYSFLDGLDVNELPVSMARCEGCATKSGESAEPITEFEWYDKSDAGSWGHHTYYLNRGGIFVDVNDQRKGTCVQDNSDSLNCQDAIFWKRTAVSQLVCNWDAPSTPSPQPSGPFKFMVVGDSISHGMEADWTWRGRLYEWLTGQGVDAQFVGPWTGTHGPIQPSDARPQPPPFDGETQAATPNTVGSYANGVSSSFASSGHASMWGRQALQSRDTIQDWVATYQPDYLLVLLGFNDLGWYVSGPDDLVGNIGSLVDNARKAKADIKILLGNVVHRRFITGRQDLVDNTNTYNALLRSRYTDWFRWESPCAYVDVQANYDCTPDACIDGYDGLHPNAKGEYHIAQAFARVLKSDFGFAGGDFVVPGTVEPRSISTPTSVATKEVPEGLYTGWDMVKTARGYEIRSRIQGMTTWWSDGDVYPNTFASWTTWLLDGQTWEFQVRTKGDNDDRSDWSALTVATAHPKTAPGPSDITCVPLPGGLQISWKAVAGYDVNRYGVIVWDQDTQGAYIETHSTTGTSYIVNGLNNGHRYGVWVSTWVNLPDGPAGGLPIASRAVIVGVGAPAPPLSITATNIDATTVMLSWPASVNAAGYKIYSRNVKDNTAFTPSESTTETSYGIAFLFPGTWNFEFCVAAYNGNMESAYPACVIPPVYPGYSKTNEVEADDTIANYTLVSNTSIAYSTASMEIDTTLQTLYDLNYHNISGIPEPVRWV